MKLRTKLIFIGLILLLSVASAFANGSREENASGGKNAGPVDITFYTYNYSAQQKDGVDALIEEFHAANPKVNVEIVFSPATDITSKIQTDLAAGVTPDVVQLIFDALDYGVNNFGIKDLNELVDEAELQAHLEGFGPAALDVARIDGNLYGLPYTFSTPVLFYNADIFRQAGLDPDVPPTTWEEVEAYALQIKENTGIDGFFFGGLSTYDWLLQALIKSNGGSVMSSDKSRITFGEAEAVEAIRMLADMRESGAHADFNESQGFSAFPEQNLGMMLTTSALQAYFIDSAEAAGWEIRTAKMPGFGTKPPVPVNSGSGIFIVSEDPAKQQAAWDFIKFVTSERGYTLITTRIGYPPLRPGIVEDEEYLKGWAEANPLIWPNLEQLEYVSQWESYPGTNWQQIELILMDALNKSIFSADTDVAETMALAAEQAQSLMPR